MTSWLLTFVVLMMMDGARVEVQHQYHETTALGCIDRLIEEQRRLVPPARIVSSSCQEVWRL